jgi:uncharacterized protein (DUF1330 family)
MIGLNYLGKMGQLGNQMFQYAALIGISKITQTKFIIPNHHELIVDTLGNRLRIELFDAFNIQPDAMGFLPAPEVKERQFTFDRGFFNLPKDTDVSLVGYFQSEKYFTHVKDEVRRQFTFHDDVINDCKNIIEDVYDNPIALHVRRGDYLRNSGNHHNLSMDYYEKALLEFPQNRQVVIFTDDPEWAMNEPLFSDDRFVVSQSAGSYHDLYLMSKCNDFIIANSTYSWWGAWLAGRGKVIAPNRWFGPNNQDKSIDDLYPDHWTMIPYC